MKDFLRSINEKLKKSITVIDNNEKKVYNSLCDMPSNDCVEYVMRAMNSYDDNEMTAEEYATAKASFKKMMISQALYRQRN